MSLLKKTEFDVTVSIHDIDLIAEIASAYSPEDVFPTKELAEWARQNGFIEESEL